MKVIDDIAQVHLKELNEQYFILMHFLQMITFIKNLHKK
jgi:hypothetical protein